jgi:hypothetical protein
VRAAGPAERVITFAAIDGPLGSPAARDQPKVKFRAPSPGSLMRGACAWPSAPLTLADAVLVGDRVPARRAALAGPADPAGGLQLPE